MGLSFINSPCPECKQVNRINCNSWAYGSPVITCKACRSEYLDKRFREVAIDGFDLRSTNAGFYLKGAAFFFVISLLLVGCIFLQNFTQGHVGTKLVLFASMGGLGTVGCLILFVRIKLGYAQKENNRYMQESLERLKDASYVKKLESFGYKIPEKFKQR